MKCVVFGGAGFIGSHLVERLSRDGHEVTAVDNLSSGRADNLSSVAGSVVFRNEDIRSAPWFASLDSDFDIAFHLAFPTPDCTRDQDHQFHDVATLGTINILDWCSRNQVRLVYGSSISVYGERGEGTPIDESTEVRPCLPYAVNKHYGEMMAASYASLYGLAFDSIRISDVYGPRDRRRNAVNNFIDAARSGRAIQVRGKGMQRRNFTYVDDIVEGLVRVGGSAAEGQTLILADAEATSVRDLAATVVSVLGSESEVSFDDVEDSRDYVFMPDRFIERFGQFAWTALATGIAATASARRG